MAVRGQKPKPTALHQLHGDPSHLRKMNEREPQPTGDLTDAPAWFTAEQRAGWNYAIEHSPPGLLRCLDRAALAAFVIAEDLHRQACEKQQRHGLVRWIGAEPAAGEPDNRTFVQSPYLPIINKQVAIMLKAAGEMGFTPSSRSRIVIETESLAQLGRVPTLRAGKAPPLSISEFNRLAPEIPKVH